MNSPLCLSAIAASCVLVSCKSSDFGAGSGAVSVEEFEHELVGAIVDYADTDGDGAMTWEEWSAVNDSADAEKFRVGDADGDGKLGKAEAEGAAKGSALWAQLIAKLDLNGDGELDNPERAAFVDELAKADDDDLVNKLVDIARE